jgi:hypothetical protein
LVVDKKEFAGLSKLEYDESVELIVGKNESN